MKSRINPLLALAIVLVACLVGCSKSKDLVVDVSDNDPQMLAAIAKARQTLPRFWEAFDKSDNTKRYFSLKVKVTDGNQVEYFWLSDIEKKDGKMRGTIDNEVEYVKNVKNGQRIEIPEADIGDWFFMKDGKMYGNYTLRVLFKQMPADEVAKYKRILAEP